MHSLEPIRPSGVLRLLSAAACVAGFAPAAALNAQTIVGHVRDDLNNAPLLQASIMLLDSTDAAVAWAESDSTGRFLLAIPQVGRYRLYADRLGYGEIISDTFRLAQAGPVELELRMVPQPLELDALVVTTQRRRERLERQGFYRRMERSMGYFLDTEQIQALKPTRASDALRRLPGVRLMRVRTGGVRPASFRLGRACPMKVVVDGWKVDMTDSDLDSFVSANDVVGIEVYTGGGGIGAPVQHRGTDAFCGVVMIWTR